MSENREHVYIPRLKEDFSEGRIDRREFLRYSTLLGLSATAAYAFVGKVTGESFAPSAQAADMPKGGVIRVGMRVPEINSPHTYSWIFDSNIARGVVEYLTRTGHDNVTRPHLAESWEVSEDLKTWTFKTRKVKWHNGVDFTAEHAVWNLKRVLDPETGSSVLGLMKGYMMNDAGDGLWDANAIEVVDANTFRMNLKSANVAVPEHLFHYPLPMLDPAEKGVFGVGSNGTGPFELVEYATGVNAVLKARSDYYGDGPYIDELHYVDLGDDPSATVAALASGQIHGHYDGDISQLDVIQQLPGLKIYQATTASTGVARVQLDREEFKDPRVTKAMRLAVDVEKTFQIAHRSIGSAAEHHHVCPVHPDYKQLPKMTRDVAAAKALLAEAGHSGGIDLEIACKKDPAWELSAVQSMVEQWAEADIRVKINVLPSAQFWDVWDKVPFGFTSWAHRPLGFMVLGLAYRSGVPWNESRMADAEFDSLLTKAEGTLDVDERREIIGQLEMIMQERGPIVQPLWRGLYSGWSVKVLGYNQHPTQYIFGETLALQG